MLPVTATGSGSYSHVRPGYVVGGGVTYSLSYAKVTVEYLYQNLGTVTETFALMPSSNCVGCNGGYAQTSMKNRHIHAQAEAQLRAVSSQFVARIECNEIRVPQKAAGAPPAALLICGCVARMSEATSGSSVRLPPGFRCAHPATSRATSCVARERAMRYHAPEKKRRASHACAHAPGRDHAIEMDKHSSNGGADAVGHSRLAGFRAKRP